jgi:kynurenine formamidase
MSGLAAVLAAERLVDLTQPLGPATTLWPGSTRFATHVVAGYARDGAYARDLATPEHAGTHLDAPAHFDPDGRRIHELPLVELVRPLALLDVRPWVDGNPNVGIGADVVAALEGRDGRIADGSAVIVHTGWDAYADTPHRYLGAAGALSFPGLERDAAELLVARGVAGVGIDTLSIDRGDSTTYPAHHTLLPAGIWQLEGLVNLAGLPARGAWLIAAALPLVDGSGSPARVFAILPE